MTAGPAGGIALALGGGCALGWAHIGVLAVLRESGVPIAAVAGTSIGALAAACLAADRLDVLEAIARSTGRMTTLSYLDPLLGRGGLLGGRRIARMLQTHLGDRSFAELAMPTACIAADLATGEEVRLTGGSLVEAVRASIALPGIFRPVALGGRRLIDGGMVANVPLAAAAALAPGRPLVGVDLFADYAGFVAEAGGVDAMSMTGTARAGFQMLMRQQTRSAALATPPAVMIAPAIGHLSPADFHRADALIAAGRAAAGHVLPVIKHASAAA